MKILLLAATLCAAPVSLECTFRELREMGYVVTSVTLTYPIPLTTLDGKTEQLTVEDDMQDGSRFLSCQEVGEKKVVTGVRCKVRGGDGAEFWVYIPAQ